MNDITQKVRAHVEKRFGISIPTLLLELCERQANAIVARLEGRGVRSLAEIRKSPEIDSELHYAGLQASNSHAACVKASRTA